MGAGDKNLNIPVVIPQLDMVPPNERQPLADETARKLYEDTRQAVVQIKTDRGSVTGFFAGNNGEIVTSARAVLGSTEQSIMGPDGKTYKAEISALDDVSDVAILKIKEGIVPPAFKGLSLDTGVGLKQDQKTYSFGFPSSYRSAYVAPGYFRNYTRPSEVVINHYPDLAKPFLMPYRRFRRRKKPTCCNT
jgi:hypothetical protein